MSSKQRNIKRVGTREEVWNGLARMTSGRLTRDNLILNKRGKIVSKKMSEKAKSTYPRLKAKLCGWEIQEAKNVIIKEVSRNPYRAMGAVGKYKGMKQKMSVREFKNFVKNKTGYQIYVNQGSYPIFDLGIVKDHGTSIGMVHRIKQDVERDYGNVESDTLWNDIRAFNAYIYAKYKNFVHFQEAKTDKRIKLIDY